MGGTFANNIHEANAHIVLPTHIKEYNACFKAGRVKMLFSFYFVDELCVWLHLMFSVVLRFSIARHSLQMATWTGGSHSMYTQVNCLYIAHSTSTHRIHTHKPKEKTFWFKRKISALTIVVAVVITIIYIQYVHM